MTDEKFEAFLARVYMDAVFREAFMRDPEAEALRAGLNPEQDAALVQIDREGLRLAAMSFTKKRKNRELPGGH